MKSFGKLWLPKRLKIIVILLLVLWLSLAGFATYTVRQSFPRESGTIQLPGIKAEVTVRRDQWGIPHIFATNSYDLFLAQGYIHAQDRFWQMDFWRHIGSGQLAEMFGSSQVETDRYLRTMGWVRVVQQEIEQMDAEMKANLQAYADGVNAYLKQRQGSALSLEYAVLKLLNPGYKPEPWQPLHSLTWGKVMAYDLGRNLDREIERAILLKTLTPAQVEELFPPYPENLPTILPGFRHERGAQKEAQRHLETTSHYSLDVVTKALEPISKPMLALEKLIGSTGVGIGSNSWVISGKRTATGKPILANDPHLAAQMPSIWYEVGLHCTLKSKECPYDVTGFSFAGMLGVIIGHNDRIAWGVTNVQSDVMDLYIEKVNPNNPNQYEVNGKWVDMQLVKQTIQVAGSEPIIQTVRYTRHGPILSDVAPNLKEFNSTQYPNLPQNYVVALRWTALEPSRLAYAIAQLNRAQNWQEFRTAASNFDVPAQNLVYADIDGNIGYQMPGKYPIRAQGDGRYPVPGWTDKYEWQGYIDFEDLPQSFNPPQGYIATANNSVSSEYPYVITKDWVYGYRAKRIVEMIEQQTQPLSVNDVQQMQGDNRNLNAQTLVPLLQVISFNTPQLQAAQKLLQDWDLQLGMTSPTAALFETFWKHLLADTFHDQLPQKYFPDGGDRWYAVVENLVKQPNSNWWDNSKTPAIENRDYILRQALTEAVAELEQIQGKNFKNWNWGKLHTITFVNATLGKSGVAPIEALFNRGSFTTAGNGETVNANRWRANKSSFQVTDIPSMRMIVDMANLDNSLAIHAPGQSGHAFHKHYTDMITPWSKIEYHPMLWENKSIAAKTTATLKLVPK
ncbi:MAG: penicillin acylase family protein [Chlorogloeopsis fritschii C42_A2020_084]|uniref:penicillin acylase family protein n=1 Tax=Chlorogloeopsis fritschii TaxID=1124 RepID=UPI0019FE6335|nr:penicillin acylase family protein [Chlorogloeopsis fritschii]MBF2005699.1 penicillin acylase family protein [Chlorogloeopsis fritschii C42_A2020_084]